KCSVMRFLQTFTRFDMPLSTWHGHFRRLVSFEAGVFPHRNHARPRCRLITIATIPTFGKHWPITHFWNEKVPAPWTTSEYQRWHLITEASIQPPDSGARSDISFTNTKILTGTKSCNHCSFLIKTKTEYPI